MGGSSRYYENKLPDWTPGCSSLLTNADGRLTGTTLSEIEGTFQKLLSVLEKNLDSSSKSDVSVYTGKAGLALLFFALGEKTGDQQYFERSLLFVEQSLQRLRGRDVTFLCGDTGPLSLAAVVKYKLGQREASAECVNAILSLSSKVISDPELPSELLYGRVGYLYSLLYLMKYIPNSVPSTLLSSIGDAVIKSGVILPQKTGIPSPLLWEWYDELYVGGAHGIAGILYFLLQIKDHLAPDCLAAIRGTIDYLLSIRFPSGNFPSSIGSSDDRLVHWCHGSPGVVQLLLAAFEAWKEKSYLDAALKCGEVVWQRGLLKKGYGICHGVAGNAYTFLALYQATGQECHLYRAVQFARWCTTYPNNQERPPDRPFSMFEGLAGTVYFLKDIQSPLQAVFPGYSLEPFSNMTS